MLVIGQKWMYSGKSVCIRAKWSNSKIVDVFWQNDSILAKGVVFGKVVDLGQKGL